MPPLAPQYGVHIVQQGRRIMRSRHAQNLVLLEFPWVVVAQTLLNFGCESVEILILSDIELRQKLNQIKWPTVNEVAQLGSRHYAFEGRCFVLAVRLMMRTADIPAKLPHDIKEPW